MSELVKTVSMRKTGQTFKAASSRHSVSAVHASNFNFGGGFFFKKNLFFI